MGARGPPSWPAAVASWSVAGRRHAAVQAAGSAPAAQESVLPSCGACRRGAGAARPTRPGCAARMRQTRARPLGPRAPRAARWADGPAAAPGAFQCDYLSFPARRTPRYVPRPAPCRCHHLFPRPTAARAQWRQRRPTGGSNPALLTSPRGSRCGRSSSCASSRFARAPRAPRAGPSASASCPRTPPGTGRSRASPVSTARCPPSARRARAARRRAPHARAPRPRRRAHAAAQSPIAHGSSGAAHRPRPARPGGPPGGRPLRRPTLHAPACPHALNPTIPPPPPPPPPAHPGRPHPRRGVGAPPVLLHGAVGGGPRGGPRDAVDERRPGGGGGADGGRTGPKGTGPGPHPG
jgi:hypothetical protein